MDIKIYPKTSNANKFLILVGGYGDTIEVFNDLASSLNDKLIDYKVCSFSLSFLSLNESILDIQTTELTEVVKEIITKNKVDYIDIFCTSMGAYATVKILNDNNYSTQIRKVIFFDPADYYISQKFGQSVDTTWSGYEAYNPSDNVISSELTEIKINTIIDVIHLNLKNYSDDGYFYKSYSKRGIDHKDGCPRLSTRMVKTFYEKTPNKNKGEYIEISNIPHGFMRDGNVELNIKSIVNIVSRLLYQN